MISVKWTLISMGIQTIQLNISSRKPHVIRLNKRISFNIYVVHDESELKKDLENYKNILTGKIVIENIRETNINSIKGYIKLKKDPKVENFGIENIVLENSVLKSTEWVLGMVLFIKTESLKMRNIPSKCTKKNYFRKLLNNFIFFFILEVILFALVIVFN